jgi:riboflavin transporter FmnP
MLKMRKKVIKRMCFDAIFAALSIVLYVFGPKFPLPFLFPGFLDVQFSMLPILIATFMLGSFDGLVVVFVRFIVKLLFGSSTMGVGETSDLILSVVVVLIISLVKYLLNKKDNYSDKKKGVLKYITLIGSWLIGSLLSNSFCIPMYCFLWGKENVMNLIMIFPFVNESNWLIYYFGLAVIPFNLMLSSLVGAITLLVDKHLLHFYNRI